MALTAIEQHISKTAMALNASSSQTAIVKLISSTPNPSGEFTITIAVSTQANSYGITGKVIYDNTRFEYVPNAATGGKAGNVYPHGASAVIADFVDMSASFSQKEFILATLTFRTKSRAPAGDGLFSYTSLNYFDTLVRAVAVAPVSVTVTIDETDTNPSTSMIQVEMDGINLLYNGEIWSGSVPSNITTIDTKDIRIHGAPNGAKVEFSPDGIIELVEGVERNIIVTITNDNKEEIHVISITRKPDGRSDTTGKANGADKISTEAWIILCAAVVILCTLVYSLTRHRKK